MPAVSRQEHGHDGVDLDVEFHPAAAPGASAVLVLPGGGFREHTDHDGTGYAQWLNAIGLGAVVLHYRLRPNPFPRALQQARAGLAALQTSALLPNVDPARVGVIGSSAGGLLAGLLATGATLFDRATRRTAAASGLSHPVLRIGRPASASAASRRGAPWRCCRLGQRAVPDHPHRRGDGTDLCLDNCRGPPQAAKRAHLDPGTGRPRGASRAARVPRGGPWLGPGRRGELRRARGIGDPAHRGMEQGMPTMARRPRPFRRWWSVTLTNCAKGDPSSTLRHPGPALVHPGPAADSPGAGGWVPGGSPAGLAGIGAEHPLVAFRISQGQLGALLRSVHWRHVDAGRLGSS